MLRILIVEDNPVNMELARQILGAEYEVDEAIDGELGVASALRRPPDVILMDLSLPVLDGWGALARIRSEAKLANIPVVALTAHAIRGDRERALAAGFDGYVTKPVEEDDLLGAIRETLARRREASIR